MTGTPDRSLAGRRAVVTGGASGIGLATAQRLLRAGATIQLWDLDEGRLATVLPALAATGQVDAQRVDVSDWEAVERAGQQALQAGNVDILMNCAGVALDVCPMTQMPLAAWHRNIEINLNSVFYCCRVFVPSMVASGWGRIVNVSSIAGKEGNAMQSAYAAAKGGVIAFTKSLGKELATTGVTVNAVAPAMFDTPLLASAFMGNPAALHGWREKIPMQRLGHVDEAAAMLAWIASEDCSFTTGFTFDLSGGRATY